MSEAPELDHLLICLHKALTSLGLRYALIGGMAVILRGYDRSTRDVDAVVLDADDCLTDILTTLSEHGVELRIPDGLEFARKNRVLLLRMVDGT